MNKYSTSSNSKAFLGALIGSFFGTLASNWIKNPKDFEKVCEILDRKIKEHKPFTQMTIEELKQVLRANVLIENYEKAIEIKKLIDYKNSNINNQQ